MIDLDIKNMELMSKVEISESTFYKIKNEENVTIDVLLRICNLLDCDILEIVERVAVSEEKIMSDKSNNQWRANEFAYLITLQ